MFPTKMVALTDAAQSSPILCAFSFVFYHHGLSGKTQLQPTRPSAVWLTMSRDRHNRVPSPPQHTSGYSQNTGLSVVHNSRKEEEEDRKQKRGSRASALEKAHKTLLPSLFLTNARSVVNKMNDLKLQLVDNRLVRDRVPKSSSKCRPFFFHWKLLSAVRITALYIASHIPVYAASSHPPQEKKPPPFLKR